MSCYQKYWTSAAKVKRCHPWPESAARLFLCDKSFQSRDVFQQALAGQHQEVIAELRVLKVDLEQLFVGDGQHVTVLDAFDGRGSPVIGRQKTEFAHQAVPAEVRRRFP